VNVGDGQNAWFAENVGCANENAGDLLAGAAVRPSKVSLRAAGGDSDRRRRFMIRSAPLNMVWER